MTRERLYPLDTTLRDGQQSQGVDFSAEDKARIARALDGLGIDYVEGGWPGANPTDSAFFATPPTLGRARLTAFGMTKRSGRSAANDDVLAAVVNAGTPAVCLVGKTHDFHVRTALGITLEENLANIAQSVAHLVALGPRGAVRRRAFLRRLEGEPGLCARLPAGRARRGRALGGALRHQWRHAAGARSARSPRAVVAAGIPGERLGIHAHDDTGNAVANSLAAVDAGARQVQGTLNGLGERCGNANLVSLIPTLLLKEPYASRFETGVARRRSPA